MRPRASLNESMSTLAIHRSDAYARQCSAVVTRVTDEGVELDRTVFYPLGGGQAGDTGLLRLADGTRFAVIDARKSKRDDATPDDTLHVLDPASGWQAKLAEGTEVTAEIDWERRYRHMRLHTATHLLCAVVRELVDGCSITAEYARLDFAMTALLEKSAVQQGLDELIGRALPVDCEWITDEEMQANPQLVKSMSVSPPIGFGRVRLVRVGDVDLQPCGGTHVRNTAEIGPVRVAKIEKKSARTRRVVLEFA
jgi:misacylated tRNA(Ala) deacylase